MRCSMVSALAENAMEANTSAMIVLRIEEYSAAELVMPGLVPGIHVLIAIAANEDVDGRACAKTHSARP